MSSRARPTRFGRTGGLAVGLMAVGALAGALVLGQASAANPASVPSAIVPLDPVRILDTRAAVGVAGTTPVAADQTITLQVIGAGGVPAGASAVLLNVTVNGATGAGYVSAYPGGGARPTASVINYSAGEDVANMITATLGANGTIDLYNAQASAHLIADVAGYLLPGAGGGTPGPQGPVGPQGPAGGSERPGLGFSEVLAIPTIGTTDIPLGVFDTATLSLRCSFTSGGTGSLRLTMGSAPGNLDVNGVRILQGVPSTDPEVAELFGQGVSGGAIYSMSSTDWTHYSATLETPAGFSQIELSILVGPSTCEINGSIDPI